MLNRILPIFGFIAALFSLLFCWMAIYDLLNPGNTDTEPGVLIGLLIFFSITLGAGIFMMLKGSWRYKRRKYEKIEREILSLIAQKGGRITPEEIALNSQMSVEDAKVHLDRMCENGSGELQVTESGRLVYVFLGFITADEKKSARSALDV